MEQKKLKGKLQALGLPDILEFLKMTENTGELILRKGPVRKTLFIEKGNVVFASSNLDEDRLGDVLLQRGLITKKAYDHSASMLGDGKRQGTILVEMGAINPKELWEGVRYQIKEIVYSLFDWDSGDFMFVEKELEKHENITVDIEITELVVEGIRKVTNRSLFMERIPTKDISLELNPGAEIKIAFEEYEKHVIGLIDGKRTVGEICSKSEIGEFETLKVLYILISIGHVNIIRPPAGVEEKKQVAEDRKEDTIIKEYNKMFSYIYRYMLREIGPVTDYLLGKYIRELQELPGGEILKDAVILKDGTLDEQLLNENLSLTEKEKSVALLVGILNEFLYKELLAIKKTLGEVHEKHVYNTLKGFRMEL